MVVSETQVMWPFLVDDNEYARPGRSGYISFEKEAILI